MDKRVRVDCSEFVNLPDWFLKSFDDGNLGHWVDFGYGLKGRLVATNEFYLEVR